MPTLRDSDQHPQDTNEKPTSDQVALLRHAVTNGAAVIAGLLAEHPTPADARLAARAWLRTWEAFKLVERLEKTNANLAALANGGAR
jgi:hypothetical protein